MIGGLFDLAAAYAVAIATGHWFSAGNRRTAHHVMDTCLDLKSVEFAWTVRQIGPLIFDVAQGKVKWLRGQAE